MTEEKVKDVITYVQDIFKELSTEEFTSFFYDENYRIILMNLRSKAKTIEEIQTHYKEASNEKSIMSIYRYLRKLKEVGLVVEAGKRIISKQNQTHETKTLYLTSAKLYYNSAISSKRYEDQPEIRQKECQIYKLLLESFFPEKEADLTEINKIIKTVYQHGINNIKKIINENEEYYKQFFSEFGMMMINTVIVHSGWMSLISNTDIKENLFKVLSERDNAK
ncbi:MAG: hypothetical protein GF308_11495 [Candidatus Heimdallarchaeota archaeon]|nr:hypothetical protein [Candidatus Heimdallarchaeota archaeon]